MTAEKHEGVVGVGSTVAVMAPRLVLTGLFAADLTPGSLVSR
ncbi:hypothetical protein [Nocardioides sp. CFH 31398]|nr:hypothetical protein [Nocardioides sp. CFH 31398]